MQGVYIGLDVHKESISIAIALEGKVLEHAKCSSDIERFVTALRKLLKKYELTQSRGQPNPGDNQIVPRIPGTNPGDNQIVPTDPGPGDNQIVPTSRSPVPGTTK